MINSERKYYFTCSLLCKRNAVPRFHSALVYQKLKRTIIATSNQTNICKSEKSCLPSIQSTSNPKEAHSEQRDDFTLQSCLKFPIYFHVNKRSYFIQKQNLQFSMQRLSLVRSSKNNPPKSRMENV